MGTAHYGLSLLLIIFDEAEVNLAGAILSKKLNNSVPNGARNILLIDWFFAHDSESEITSSHTTGQPFFPLTMRTPWAT